MNNDPGILNKESTHKCEKCQNVFTDKSILIEHMNNHITHTENVPDQYMPAFPYTCEMCNKSFTHKGNFQNHMKYHKGKQNNVDATQVKESCPTEKAQKTSKVKFSEIHNCEICGNVFISETPLKEHLTKSHKEINIEKALVDGTEDCKCVYPCIPTKPCVEAPVSTKKQLHCCLNDTPGCSFQCETQEELQHHIEIKHRSKIHLQCTVCNIVFINLDNLAKHMKLSHKKSEDDEMHYSCHSCPEKFKTKNEVDIHINEDHISYKPWRNFATNNCEYNEECRFEHIVLKKGEHICYKCGLKFTNKSVLLNHIKNIHNDLCLKHLEGKCTYGSRCVYKHAETNSLDVVRNFKNIQLPVPEINSHMDFPQIPPTEKRLGGNNKKTIDHLMENMNQMVSQMNQIMTLMKNMVNQ